MAFLNVGDSVESLFLPARISTIVEVGNSPIHGRYAVAALPNGEHRTIFLKFWDGEKDQSVRRRKSRKRKKLVPVYSEE